ncbi:collagen alpha-1(I) chain-like [Mustela erminea]|uniref:collagen alpha-1(I) chain-like n=1 Tax=Mustela erminea TaxID=36723 RepID=UPI001386FE16|nr:collagen alpha-1(I) chain-like [Mustela erminea]
MNGKIKPGERNRPDLRGRGGARGGSREAGAHGGPPGTAPGAERGPRGPRGNAPAPAATLVRDADRTAREGPVHPCFLILLEELGGLGPGTQGPGATGLPRTRHRPKTAVASAGAPGRARRAAAAASVSRSAQWGCPATSPRATPSRGRRLQSPPGPLTSARPGATPLGRAARGVGCACGSGRPRLGTPRLRQDRNVAAGAGRPLPGGSSYPPRPSPPAAHRAVREAAPDPRVGGKLRPQSPGQSWSAAGDLEPRAPPQAVRGPRTQPTAGRTRSPSLPLSRPLIPPGPLFPPSQAWDGFGPAPPLGGLLSSPRGPGELPGDSTRPLKFSNLFLGLIHFCFRHCQRPAAHPRLPGSAWGRSLGGL